MVCVKLYVGNRRNYSFGLNFDNSVSTSWVTCELIDKNEAFRLIKRKDTYIGGLILGQQVTITESQ